MGINMLRNVNMITLKLDLKGRNYLLIKYF